MLRNSNVKFSGKLLHDNTARATKWKTNNHIRTQHQQVHSKKSIYPKTQKIPKLSFFLPVQASILPGNRPMPPPSMESSLAIASHTEPGSSI